MAIVMLLTTLSGHTEKGPTPNCRGRFDSHSIANLDNHFFFPPDDRTPNDRKIGAAAWTKAGTVAMPVI